MDEPTYELDAGTENVLNCCSDIQRSYGGRLNASAQLTRFFEEQVFQDAAETHESYIYDGPKVRP